VSSRDADGPTHTGPDPGSGARPSAPLTVRISPADVGRRVTVRHRLDSSTATDVVGRLRSWDGGWTGGLVVERRDGTPVGVPASDVVAARVVPPEIAAEAMQAVAERGWPAAETAPLGEWVLRASGGVTGRANSVRLAGRPGVPLADALAAVEGWYADRALPPLLQVPVPSAYDDDLAALGWVVTRSTVLLTAPTADVLSRAGTRQSVDLAITGAPVPGREWLAFVEPDLDPESLAAILVRPREVVFVEARDSSTGALLGAARASAASSPVGRWAGITSVMTAPEARRRGVATAVLRELATWAADARCPHTYLQVLGSNVEARRLYAGLGFELHHRYEYLAPQRVASP
jgi:ribosomal protein S18 acetylase RimI-like enzyme